MTVDQLRKEFKDVVMGDRERLFCEYVIGFTGLFRHSDRKKIIDKMLEINSKVKT